MTVSIREVHGVDLNRVNRMQADILPSDIPFNTGTGWWWAANENGRDVGFAGMVQSTQWHDAAYLCRAGVTRSARGHGLQKRLIRVREQKARALGLRYLITETFNNPASANSLISCGFRMYLPKRPWAGDGCLYWRKSITMVKET